MLLCVEVKKILIEKLKKLAVFVLLQTDDSLLCCSDEWILFLWDVKHLWLHLWVSEWVILHALKDMYAINIYLLQSFIGLCFADRYVLLGISHGSLSGNDNLGAVASMMELARVFGVLSRDRGNWIYLYCYIRLNHDKLEGIACPEYISFLSDACRLVFQLSWMPDLPSFAAKV